MYKKIEQYYASQLDEIRKMGVFKQERFIRSPQGAGIWVEFPEGSELKEVLNFCANNYLGLANHPDVIQAALDGIRTRGYGLSSVRFICGTQDIHRELENKLTRFLGTEDTILFGSCMNANGAIFASLLDENDAVISDRLIHASLIDGIRLCTASRHIYNHVDMADLEEKLKATQNKRFRMIVTDGVFSMDGSIAPLEKIVELGKKYNALVMMDDSHATGFLGKTGRGTHELKGMMGEIDLITTTMGKALGGASGGCISGRKEMIEVCRQKSRAYIFSNSIPPMLVAASSKVLDILSETTERRDKLEKNTKYFRAKMTEAGFDIKPGIHPIVPVMFYNAKLANDFAHEMYHEGIYVVGFGFPVVPKGEARIRVQLSALHERKHLDKALNAFIKIGKKYNIPGKTREEIIATYGL